jgi:hypothetical protein
MEKVKSAVEIAMEKASQIGELTQEDKEKIKDKEWLQSVLADFYQDRINSENLWQTLKNKSKAYLFKKAQLHLIDSLSIKSLPTEIQKRKEAVLAIETLKNNQKTSILESQLNTIVNLQNRAKNEKEQKYNDFRKQIEKNPKLRITKQQVQTEEGTMIIQTHLSVDEAVTLLPEWKKFLSYHEEHYTQEFMTIINKLKEEIE